MAKEEYTAFRPIRMYFNHPHAKCGKINSTKVLGFWRFLTVSGLIVNVKTLKHYAIVACYAILLLSTRNIVSHKADLFGTPILDFHRWFSRYQVSGISVLRSIQPA